MLSKVSTLTIVLFIIFTSIIPKDTLGLIIPPDIGTGTQVPSGSGSLSCAGTWTKIICVIKKTSDIIKSIQKVTRALDNVPHSFPFGGPILSSERACSFKFSETVWAPNPFFGIPPTLPYGPFPITIPLGGRAIVVGPPISSGGKVIAFPWISQIYDQHTENRAGPWALGLGFSPFPLKDINDPLRDIKIWIPPLPFDPPCSVGGFASAYIGSCTTNFHFECQASGEKDASGNDIYKVIRKLGTSKDDVPASTLQELKTKFPSFSWPLP